jgi:hypothetical protein
VAASIPDVVFALLEAVAQACDEERRGALGDPHAVVAGLGLP